MKMLLRAAVLLLVFAVAGRAQLSTPLTSDAAAQATLPGGWMSKEGQADAALQAGFSATAMAIYREVLALPAVPAEVRNRVQLSLVTAAMEAGEVRIAETELEHYDGPRNSAYQLRLGLLAANTRRWPQVKAALAAGKADELPPADRGWWHFLEAQLAEAEAPGDFARKQRAYEAANNAAVSELQRTRFQLGQDLARLRGNAPDETLLASYKANAERNPSTRLGHEAVWTYAAALSKLQRKTEAITVLQRLLSLLPASERNALDETRLLLGAIAGEDSQAGRRALIELLAKGSDPEKQRMGLQLLSRAASASEDPRQREQLRRDLSELISAPTMHPIMENLLLARANTLLQDKQYSLAEEDARLLLERFPGSPLKAAALGVRLSVAWDSKRYRSAAEVAAQLRAELPPGRERAEKSVMQAEAFFRVGDFRSAADAYRAALEEPGQPVAAGILIYQRVLAEISADQLEAAAKELDAMATNAAFDPVHQWRAEWNLVKALQVNNRADAAQQRVERLLGQGTKGVPDELRIRLLWLRAKLSFDNRQEAAAIKQVDELIVALNGVKLEAGLRQEVASTGLLLKAQALLSLGRDDEGGALLDKLRKDYPKAKAAAYSYIVQAARFSERGETVKAQQLLTALADEHPDSEYAPLALYEAALNAEKRGLDDYLREAYVLLEKRLVKNYPNDELVFYARLKEGDLLRKLNDFGAARPIYEDLVNNHALHPDVLLAQLALADTLFAQGGSVNAESAATIYERLRDLPNAPVDLRVEAGYRWGYTLTKRGQPAKAVTVFWSVVNTFLLDAPQAAKLGATGRYWMTRLLLELGQLHEDAGRLDEAQRAYQLVIDQKLGGEALAQSKLARFRAPEAKK